MRSCMRLKAVAALRTSVAPSGRMAPLSRPRPKSSAAAARRRMARTWLRMNSAAMPNSRMELPPSHST